jgi:predicted LPLAT superfamily acyltransferase
MSQSRSSHWSNIGESGTVLGMQILLWVYRLLGRRVFRWVLAPVMLYYVTVKPSAKAASQQYLDRIQTQLDSPSNAQEQPRLTPFAHFMSFGETLLDKFLAWMGHIAREDVIFENRELLNHIDQTGQGGIIVISHLGNTEICSALAHQLPNIRLTLLVYTQHADKFNSMMKRVSPDAQINFLQVTDMSPATAMLLNERVEQGELIVIAGDRTPVTGDARISYVDFLGEQAPMPQGAFILASLLKCPVYLMFCLKQSSRYHIYVETFAEKVTLKRQERQQALDNVVQDYANRLAYYCKKAPLQWFNFYDFWRHQSPSSARAPKDNERS